MKRNLGQIIWACTAFIVLMGLLTLYSASYQNVRVSNQIFYDQLICAGMGFLLMLFLSRIDYRKFYDLAYILYGVALILLMLVLIKGRHALGAQRWLSLGGLSFQPSEIAKFSLIIALGRYFSQRREILGFGLRRGIHAIGKDFLLPLFLTAMPMLLTFKQPDLGTALLFGGIFIIMLFVSGVDYRYFTGFLLLCAALTPFAWHILRPYQRDRLLVFLNPNIDPLGAGYTIIQSRIAVGSGQLLGKGWLAGTQNQLNFLPERHTDFIFSVIGEEWGMFGATLLIFCYFVLIYCGLKIAEQVNDAFGTQVAVGIVGILFLQVVINIGMVMGLCPVVGLTLPLVSYGRTSFMIFIIMIGILLNLSKRRVTF